MQKLHLFASIAIIAISTQSSAVERDINIIDNAFKAVHGEKVWSSQIDENTFLYIAPIVENDLRNDAYSDVKAATNIAEKRADNYLEINKDSNLFFGSYAVSLVSKAGLLNREAIGHVSIGAPIYYCPIQGKHMSIDRTDYLDDKGWSEILIDGLSKSNEHLRSRIYQLLVEKMPVVHTQPIIQAFSLDTGTYCLLASSEEFKGLETLESITDIDAIQGALDAGFKPYDFAPGHDLVVLRYTSDPIESKIDKDVLNAFNDLKNEEAQQIIRVAAGKKIDDVESIAKLIADQFGLRVFDFDPRKHTLDNLNEFKEQNLSGVVVTRMPQLNSCCTFNGTFDQHMNFLKYLGLDGSQRN